MAVTAGDLESSLQGRWQSRRPIGDASQHSRDALVELRAGVSIDSRTLGPGAIFFAIQGENFDGHDFVSQAFDAGASLAIVSKPVKPAAEHPVLIVEDTIAALQRLAALHRRNLRNVIAVAGSNGKTTTRHVLHHVLTATLTGTQSPKSFNNHLGVPLTLLNASPDHDFVVVEVGTNHPGEIASLAAIAQPDIGIVTSIGEEHLAFFHDLDGVAREEFSLLPAIHHDGLAVIPTLDYPLPDHACRLQRISLDDPDNPAIRLAPYINLPGHHNILNAAFAAAIALHLGLDEETIVERLKTVQPVEMRSVLRYLGRDPDATITSEVSSDPTGISYMEILSGPSSIGAWNPIASMDPAHRGITLYEDCYNANPSSMRAAIQTLKHLPALHHVAILGDMYELGENTPQLHASVGRFAAETKLSHVVLIGEHMAHAAAAFEQHQQPDSTYEHIAAFEEHVPQHIADMLDHGDAVLIKASRGMRLERLIPAIETKFELD